MIYRLRCARCGDAFQPDGATLQEMIVLVRLKEGSRVLVHMEPCSLAVRR